MLNNLPVYLGTSMPTTFPDTLHSMIAKPAHSGRYNRRLGICHVRNSMFTGINCTWILKLPFTLLHCHGESADFLKHGSRSKRSILQTKVRVRLSQYYFPIQTKLPIDSVTDEQLLFSSERSDVERQRSSASLSINWSAYRSVSFTTQSK